MASIEVIGVRKEYDTGADRPAFCALDAVSFQVKDGEFVCLLGPSGCGKTTLLNILSGLDTRYTGRVLFNGKLRAPAEMPAVHIGYIFQEPRLLPWLTVRQNLEFVLESEGYPREEWEERVRRYLELVGLWNYRDYYPAQLSGGMAQRVSLARAFAVDPDVLLMDEPFSALDELTARKMRRELLHIWSRLQKTVIFVTHNAYEAVYLADRIFLMTKSPGSIYDEITIPLARPRRYSDPQIFALNARIVNDFLRHNYEETDVSELL
ncbi:MAG: ABC transporter ATP-binding protein [Nitrospinota bacterium]|nr:MAG: ABC transporter ATP-binding protein [Nitrospinota bacterium]